MTVGDGFGGRGCTRRGRELHGCNSGRPCRVVWFVRRDNDDTAAAARIEDVAACAARVDAQVRVVLGRVMAQRRSVEVAFAYLAALSPGTRANCWSLAEAAGHEGWTRMQALLGAYRWDWEDLRAQLPALAAAWLGGSPAAEDDLVGPGIAIDETAQLKKGDATACAAACRVHRQGGELREHRVLRLCHRGRARLGGLRRVHAQAVGR